jgi:prevent-host-death family protein
MFVTIHIDMKQYISSPITKERERAARQVIINASEGYRAFGKLLKRVYNSAEHLVVEQDGFPVAVLMSYQEYEQLSQLSTEVEESPSEHLPVPTMTLEQTFGAVTPINRPEDFAAIRETAIEELVQQTVTKMNR